MRGRIGRKRAPTQTSSKKHARTSLSPRLHVREENRPKQDTPSCSPAHPESPFWSLSSSGPVAFCLALARKSWEVRGEQTGKSLTSLLSSGGQSMGTPWRQTALLQGRELRSRACRHKVTPSCAREQAWGGRPAHPCQSTWPPYLVPMIALQRGHLYPCSHVRNSDLSAQQKATQLVVSESRDLN